MRPGWIRRRGSDLIALGFGVPIMFFTWPLTRGLGSGVTDNSAIQRAVHWSLYFAPLLWIGVALWIVGGTKGKSKGIHCSNLGAVAKKPRM